VNFKADNNLPSARFALDKFCRINRCIHDKSDSLFEKGVSLLVACNGVKIKVFSVFRM
jgi:hypothetical protein